MKKTKNIGLWILSVFFIIAALAYFPSISTLLAILVATLTIPIASWQKILQKFVRGKLKVIIVVALALLTLAIAPKANDSTLTEKPLTTTPTTVPETTVPETTVPATTVPETTVPETTVPATTVPATTIPATTVPATTVPATTVPATTVPATTVPATTEPPHTHSYSSATCTTPATCSCGATQGSANGHNYTNGKCSVCGTKDPNYNEITYVLNTNSMKFHNPGCSRLPTQNRLDTTKSREEVINQGYEPCGICHP